jgi:hypothetical protein
MIIAQRRDGKFGSAPLRSCKSAGKRDRGKRYNEIVCMLDYGSLMYIVATYTIGQIALAGVALIAAAYLTYVRAFKR